jgi:hypothetical protein
MNEKKVSRIIVKKYFLFFKINISKIEIIINGIIIENINSIIIVFK